MYFIVGFFCYKCFLIDNVRCSLSLLFNVFHTRNDVGIHMANPFYTIVEWLT